MSIKNKYFIPLRFTSPVVYVISMLQCLSAKVAWDNGCLCLKAHNVFVGSLNITAGSK